MLILYVACDEFHKLLDPLKFGCVAALIAYGFTYGLVSPFIFFKFSIHIGLTTFLWLC